MAGVALLLALSASATQAQTSIDWTDVAGALGKPGTVQPGEVYKVGFPRGDLHVTVGGVQVKPALALGSWVPFGQKAAVTGDFVLIGSEVDPVIRILRQNGIEVTALHSHMLDESPRLYFMRFCANDDAIHLAGGLRAALGR